MAFVCVYVNMCLHECVCVYVFLVVFKIYSGLFIYLLSVCFLRREEEGMESGWLEMRKGKPCPEYIV